MGSRQRPGARATTPLTADAVVATLTEIGDAVWAATRALEYVPECCIAATGAARRMVDKQGWTSSPVVVRVMVGNAAAFTSLAAGEDPDFAGGAWTVGVDDRAPEDFQAARMDPAISARLDRTGRFRGHLILLVHTSAGDFFLDASAAQFDRPARDLSVSAFAVPVEPEWVVERRMFHRFESGGFVRYELIPAPDVDYRMARDWDVARHRKIVAAAGRALQG